MQSSRKGIFCDLQSRVLTLALTRCVLGAFAQAAHALHFLLVDFDFAFLFQFLAQVLNVQSFEHLTLLVEQSFLGAVPCSLGFLRRF